MIHETENQHIIFRVDIHIFRKKYRNILSSDCAKRQWKQLSALKSDLCMCEQWQTLIYMTQSAGENAELTNQLAKKQI